MDFDETLIVLKYKRRMSEILKEYGQDVDEKENFIWFENLMRKTGALKAYPTLKRVFSYMYNARLTNDEQLEVLENLYEGAFVPAYKEE